MPNAKVVSFSINSLEINWSEDSKRKATPCHYCKTPTRGRTNIATNGGKSRPFSACQKCAIEQAVATAFRPLKDAMAEVR